MLYCTILYYTILKARFEKLRLGSTDALFDYLLFPLSETIRALTSCKFTAWRWVLSR